MARIFLSSVYSELIDYREAAAQAVVDSGHVRVGMESFVANDAARISSDAASVRSCEYFVVLIGRQYGNLGPDGRTSYTELEFQTARQAGLKILPFYLDIGAPFRPMSPLEEEGIDLNFQRDARNQFFRVLSTGMSPVPVKNPEDFKYRLSRALPQADPVAQPAPRKINQMLARLCDRVDQGDDFADLFNAPGRFVNIYVLYGIPLRSSETRYLACVKWCGSPSLLAMRRRVRTDSR